MTPDFSPKMLRGFVSARISMAGYKTMFPDDRKGSRQSAPTFDAACEKERLRIMKRADVTADQMELVLSSRVVGRAARERLWKALGADPADFGIRLLDGTKQERLP